MRYACDTHATGLASRLLCTAPAPPRRQASARRALAPGQNARPRSLSKFRALLAGQTHETTRHVRHYSRCRRASAQFLQAVPRAYLQLGCQGPSAASSGAPAPVIPMPPLPLDDPPVWHRDLPAARAPVQGHPQPRRRRVQVGAATACCAGEVHAGGPATSWHCGSCARALAWARMPHQHLTTY
jgi:hypothetical protein